MQGIYNGTFIPRVQLQGNQGGNVNQVEANQLQQAIDNSVADSSVASLIQSSTNQVSSRYNAQGGIQVMFASQKPSDEVVLIVNNYIKENIGVLLNEGVTLGGFPSPVTTIFLQEGSDCISFEEFDSSNQTEWCLLLQGKAKDRATDKKLYNLITAATAEQLMASGNRHPFIQRDLESGDFIRGKAVSELFQEHSKNALKNLNSECIQKYINNGKLTIEQARNIREDQRALLEKNYIQKYLDNDKLTVKRAINLSHAASLNLRGEEVQKYIDNGLLTVEQAINLNGSLIHTLEEKNVQKYIYNGKLTIEQAKKLSFDTERNLKKEGVQKYIDNGKISMEQVIKLSEGEGWSLCDAVAQKCIDNEELTVEQVINIGLGAVTYICRDKLTIEQALNLSPVAKTNLKREGVQKYIDNSKLPIEQAIGLSDNQGMYLCDKVTQKYIDNGKLTIDQVINSYPRDIQRLIWDFADKEAIQKYIDNGKLTEEQALNLSAEAKQYLNTVVIEKYIDNGKLTVHQVITLSVDELKALIQKIETV